MRQSWRSIGWVVGGALVSGAGAIVMARSAIDAQRVLFETDARIVHRLLSQQVVQHDAILATLALLQPAPEASGATPPEQRLPSLYTHILSVQRRDRGAAWPDPSLAAAESASALARRPALAAADLPSGRYRLVLAAEPTAYALTIDLRGMVPWTEWPMKRETSPMQVELEHAGQRFGLQAGDTRSLNAGGGWSFAFHKHLAAASQPFDVVARQRMGWSQLPWWRMLGWTLAVAAVLGALAQLQRQRTARRRAEELLRLGLTGHGTVQMCRRAFKAGAAEFLEKPVNDELLIEALQNAVRQHVRSRERHQAGRVARERYAQLSERERDVLGLIVAGLTNKEIGRALDLSPRTVETHRANLFAKLQAESLAQLIRHYAALVDESDSR